MEDRPPADTAWDAEGKDRVIAGAGTPEAAWRAWPGLSALPATDLGVLVPPGRRAVIVAPHPDDELLGCGGLIASLLLRNGAAAAAPHLSSTPILLIAATDGGGSHPGSSLWPPDRLVRVRPMETSAALQRLAQAAGAGALENLQIVRAGLPDGGVSACEQRLTDLLTSTCSADDVIFASWRFDGHPDHEAVGRAAVRAVERLGATLVEMPIWAWHWGKPGDARFPWRRARRLLLTQAVTQAKRLAAQAYPSQLQADPATGAEPILPPYVLERVLREFELFFVA